jgi:general secretion pathway protein D
VNFYKVLVGAGIMVVLYGCTADRLNREGMRQIAEGHEVEGVAKLEEAAKSAPSNLHYRAQFINKQAEVINRLLNEASVHRVNGRLDAAEQTYRRMLVVEPGNERANEGLAELTKDRRHLPLNEEARNLLKQGDADAALVKLHSVLIENPDNAEAQSLKQEIEAQRAKETMAVPTLKSLYKKPISLEFREANFKVVLELLSRTTGINFILDKDVRPDLSVTIFVKHGSLDSIIDLLTTTNQLQKKILDANTVLIYSNTPDKAREYQDLMVKSFYIENADVKQTMSMVKTLLKTREIFVDEKLNLMIMRDTPETIQLAEKLIRMQDLAEPEVMLEVEVLEVTRSRLLNLGVQYPSQLTLSPLTGTGGASLTLNDLKAINSGRIGADVGNIIINAQKTDSDVNLLANPRIRTRNREEAKIMIGDRLPVITTTSSSTGFVSDNVQYVDVGLKLDVTPTIYLQDEVAIKVALEVSSIVNQVTSKNGTLAYQIGSRNASTVLRLKDGETQVLAGLINNSDRASASKIPGMGDLPILGRLFSSHRDDNQKTEIVLSITPHLVRSLKRPDAQDAEFWSGSELSQRTTQLVLQSAKSPSTEAELQGAGQVAPTRQPNVVAKDDADVDPTKFPTLVSLAWQGDSHVKKGEQFRVALILKTDGGLRSLPFQVAFDPNLLKVEEVVEGDFFKQNGGNTSYTSNIDVASGKIFVGAVRSDSEGAAGEGSVSTITFKALKSGEAQVKLVAATPVGVGEKPPRLDMPDTYSVSIGE